MPNNITRIDNKFRRNKTKKMEQQCEYDVMIKSQSQRAMERFKSEPYQLRYAREHGESRTEQQTEKNIGKEQSRS